jgi:DNA ligase-1
MAPKASEYSFNQLVEAFEKLNATRSGNEMIEILSELFSEVPHGIIDTVSYFIQGNLVAEYVDLNLHIGDKLMAEAIARTSGKNRDEIEALFHEQGDYGLVAESVLGSHSSTSASLTVDSVHKQLLAVADATGTGSQDAKMELIGDLLSEATSLEAKYIVKIALGVLRLGAGTMTILNGLAVAYTGEKKNKKHLERAYNLCGDLGRIASTVAKTGLEGLEKIQIEVGHPIKVMAAQRVKKLADLFEKMPDGLAAEFKYDGERLQCHKKGEMITIYSRNMENITFQYPDVVERMQQQIKAKDAIVEGEAVALVPGKTDEFQEFQVLMKRRRKYDLELFIEEIPVKVFLFDVLYVDGEDVMGKPYPERRKILEKLVKNSGDFEPAHALFSSDPEEIENFFLQAVEKKFEGIMAKSCAEDSTYRAGARQWGWIKWKRDYSSDLVDTFDLAVLGGIAGRGKRSGTWGALLCGVYNPELDRYETLCKVSTGFSDQQLETLPELFRADELDENAPRVFSKMKPTQWFEPQIVLEVSGAELTKSPIHTCGSIDENSPGVALRFPRFLRFREDKNPEQATTTAEIISLFQGQ